MKAGIPVLSMCLAVFLLGSISEAASSLSYGDTTPRKPHWSDHPVLQSNPTVKPPICVLYTTRTNKLEITLESKGMLRRRSSKYLLVDPAFDGTEEARQLLDYDVLTFSPGKVEGRPNALQIETSRDSKVCLLVTVKDSGFKLQRDATMKPPPGYSFLGVAHWDGEPEPEPRYPEAQVYSTKNIPKGVVMCKTLARGSHDFPSPDALGAQYKVSRYSLLFAETDGTAPELPSMPSGWSGPAIERHERCPNALHDMWMVENHDADDADTAGKKWHSWHPQKDYVYDCYYGHEHGTPGMLAGYTERLDYTAWKNSRQDESHDGFKSYVMPVPDNNLFLVVNLHADTKDIRRVDKEFHTMVVAVTQQGSGKHLFEMSCKASSGGSACDYQNRPTEGLPYYPVGSTEAQNLIKEAYGDTKTRVNHRKRVNCWNPNKFNPKLKTRDGIPSIGQYEGWFMKTQEEMCMYSPSPRSSAGPEIDIKNSHNGCADQGCKSAVTLGFRSEDGATVTRPNIGTNRRIKFRELSIGPAFCKHELPEPGADGYIVFYTNPTCTEPCGGPGENCVKQVMHSSFQGFNITGTFEVSDVHGHNLYELVSTEAGNEKGLQGVYEIEGGISKWI